MLLHLLCVLDQDWPRFLLKMHLNETFYLDNSKVYKSSTLGLFFLAQNDVTSFMSDIFETVGHEVICSSLNISNCVFGKYWHSTDAERLLLGTGA